GCGGGCIKRAPTPTLPRKRGRGQSGACSKLPPRKRGRGQSGACSKLPPRLRGRGQGGACSKLPPPLAGEGWGGGVRSVAIMNTPFRLHRLAVAPMLEFRARNSLDSAT